MTRTGRNIWAFLGQDTAPKCLVLLASHYDTKDLGAVVYRGANDGASSSAALLALLRAVSTGERRSDVFRFRFFCVELADF